MIEFSNHLRYTAVTNLKWCILWRHAPLRVHGCHEPYMVRGAPRVIRTPDLRIRSPKRAIFLTP